jgi:hypothetical protein
MSTYLRGRTFWYKFHWRLKNEQGREIYHIQRSARTRNKRKAEGVEEEHRSALRNGLVHPLDAWPKPKRPSAPPLREFSERFLAYVQRETRPSTVAFYERCLRRVLRFAPLADMAIDAGHAVSTAGRSGRAGFKAVFLKGFQHRTALSMGGSVMGAQVPIALPKGLIQLCFEP